MRFQGLGSEVVLLRLPGLASQASFLESYVEPMAGGRVQSVGYRGGKSPRFQVRKKSTLKDDHRRNDEAFASSNESPQTHRGQQAFQSVVGLAWHLESTLPLNPHCVVVQQSSLRSSELIGQLNRDVEKWVQGLAYLTPRHKCGLMLVGIGCSKISCLNQPGS